MNGPDSIRGCTTLVLALIVACMLKPMCLPATAQADTAKLLEEARLLHKKKEYALAAKLYAKVLDLAPTADCYQKEGECLLELGKYEEAISYFNRALELAPKDCAVYAQRGACYGKLKNKTMATTDFETALRLSRDLPQTLARPVQMGIYVYYTEAMQDCDDLEKAISLLESNFEVCPNPELKACCLKQQVLLYTKLRDFGNVDRILTRILQFEGDSAIVLNGRAECRELLGNIKGALEDAELALKMDPNNDMSKTLIKKIRSRTIADKDPSDEEKRAAEALLSRARRLLKDRQALFALVLTDFAIRLNPNLSEAFSFRTVCADLARNGVITTQGEAKIAHDRAIRNVINSYIQADFKNPQEKSESLVYLDDSYIDSDGENLNSLKTPHSGEIRVAEAFELSITDTFIAPPYAIAQCKKTYKGLLDEQKHGTNGSWNGKTEQIIFLVRKGTHWKISAALTLTAEGITKDPDIEVDFHTPKLVRLGQDFAMRIEAQGQAASEALNAQLSATPGLTNPAILRMPGSLEVTFHNPKVYSDITVTTVLRNKRQLTEKKGYLYFCRRLIPCALPGTQSLQEIALASLKPIPIESSTLAENTPVRDKWALVVGIDRFKEPDIPGLKYAGKDASDFAKFLVEKANFAPDHVRLLLNEKASKEQILTELGDTFLPRVVKPDDLVLLYFSTHGSPSKKDVRQRNFLIAYDTKKTNLFASGIEMQALTDLLADRVGANRVLIVLDACHSGGATSDGSKGMEDYSLEMEKISLGKGQLVISSSSKDQLSWESKRYPNGIFTRKLIEALQKRGAATPLSEAFEAIERTVADEVQQDEGQGQTPQLKSDTWVGNELLLAAPPQAPAPLPKEVAKLLKPDSKAVPAQKVQNSAPKQSSKSKPK